MTQSSNKQNERSVGFEIEFADVPLKEVAAIIKRQFGGEAQQCTSAEWVVSNTELGDFRLEIDAGPIKKAASRFVVQENEDNDSVISRLRDKVSSFANTAVDSIGTKVAPLEIVGPPIGIDEISKMDKLCEALRNESALGTKSSLHHAFGLHINPEALSTNVDSILCHMQAFALLYERLLDLHRVDMARRLSTYISSYPEDFVDTIIADDYTPELDQLIKDYHAHKLTRNQALDMLPLFSHLNNDLVRDLYGYGEKINARPTYHYRLPNSEIDSAAWSLKGEWEKWRLIEKVANHPVCLQALKDAWKERESSSIARAVEGEEKWKKTVISILDKHDVKHK